MENENIKPVFNYCDEQQKESLKMFVSSAFELCPQIVHILKEHGMNVTEKVLCDCVQMRRKEEVVEEVKRINYNFYKSELMPHEVVTKVTYTPSNEFLKEWQKIKDRRIKASGAMSPIELKEVTDKIDKECNEIMDAICNVYKGGQAELGRGYLAKIITVDNDGKPCFKTDIDTFCANMASVYVTCTRSLKALELQRELCKKANELVKLVKPTSLDIRKIFCVNPVNDEVKPSPIDFDLYLKNR